MSKAEILRELPKLKPDERQEIRAKLNELDGVADGVWMDGGELTEEEKRMLDARLTEYEKNPNEGSSWEEVEVRLRAQVKGVLPKSGWFKIKHPDWGRSDKRVFPR